MAGKGGFTAYFLITKNKDMKEVTISGSYWNTLSGSNQGFRLNCFVGVSELVTFISLSSYFS